MSEQDTSVDGELSEEEAMEAVAPAKNIENTRVENEMEQSYIDYAMSVIAGRALPDVRDGLKPVHRRILYAMYENGVTSGSSHTKSSAVVGDTMGDYHPHGDSAIYDALARMSQDFSMRYPLVDGQGNFGSIDDDPPAAMRYTEARMSSIAEELMSDIDMETVDFQSNYDDRKTEPTVLPARFPNLLVNGSSGIAVGMSTKIPPHNLGEVIDATVHLIDNPDADVSDLMEFVEGPDFPTGAKIVGREGIKNAYETGRGTVRMRADYTVDEDERQIIINEIPYQQNKSRMVERIAQSVEEGRIEGISGLRDESDRDGIRVVVDVKRGAVIDVVENKLLQHHLEKSFGIINLSLVDGQPQVLSLKETLQEYVDHRRDVVRRRSNHELENARDRIHILEGRLKAIENTDDVVDIVRNSDSRDDAKEELMDEYGFSDEQVDHIVRMQIGSLTSMEEGEIRDEYEEVENRIERLEEVLEDESELMGVIKDELEEIKDEYDDERRTEIIQDTESVSNEDLIPEEDIYVLLTRDGYVKRMSQDTLSTQNRGGKGVIGTSLKRGDEVVSVSCMSTHDYLLLFTNKGQVHQLKGYNLPDSSRQARGDSVAQHLDLDGDEEVVSLFGIEELDNNGDSLTMVTKNGYIKRTPLTEFQNIQRGGIRAASVENGDEIVDVLAPHHPDSFVVTTKEGRAIRFSSGDVRTMGRAAQGVSAIELQGEDEVVSLVSVNDEGPSYLMTVTENGFGKRSPLTEYRVQSRYGKGLLDINTGDRNGSAVVASGVEEDDDLVVTTREGQILRTRVSDISSVSRNTKGVKIMSTDEEDEVVDMSVISQN